MVINTRDEPLSDTFNAVLKDAHKVGVNLDDPIDRAMIVATLMRLVELELGETLRERVVELEGELREWKRLMLER